MNATPDTIALAHWHSAHPSGTIAGSLYAVPAAHRVAAAQLLTAAHCLIHADVIIDDRGRHIGVTPRELRDIAAQLPFNQIDLHVIVLPGEPNGMTTATLRSTLRLAAALPISRLHVAQQLLQTHRPLLEDLIHGPIPIWIEVSPSDPLPELPLTDADGLLLMLIEPGTTQAANPGRIHDLSVLARALPVGVDGGVTSDIARQAANAGATLVVSGRALLTVPVPPSMPEDTTPGALQISTTNKEALS